MRARENRCRSGQPITWCGWRDLNPHALRRQNLNLVRLPISPHPHGIADRKRAPLAYSLAKRATGCEGKSRPTRPVSSEKKARH